MERNCLGCQFCVLIEGEPGYSEYTPSSPMRFYCDKDVWNADKSDDKQFILEAAKQCKFFVPESWNVNKKE